MTRLLTLTRDYFSWLTILTRKTKSIAAVDLLSSVFLFLVNQVCLILSFFLPLKILILVGTEGVPRYFRAFMTPENKNEFIIWFLVAAIVIYICYLVTDVIMGRKAMRAGSLIVSRADKLSTIEKPDHYAREIFLKVARSWASYLMVIGGFILIAWLEWRIFAVLLTLVVIEFIAFGVLWERLQAPDQLSRRMNFVKNKNMLLNVGSAVNFLTAFALLFYFFLSGEGMNFIVAIVLMLLSRQIMTRLSAGIKEAGALLEQRAKIEAVFFPESTLQEQVRHEDQSFFHALFPENRQTLFSMISSKCGADLSLYDWEWTDSAPRNIACFSAEQVSSEQDNTKNDSPANGLLLKVYAANQQKNYQSEVTLYKGLRGKHPLVPELLSHGELGGMTYTLLEHAGGTQPEAKQLAELHKKARTALWQFLPSPELCSKFLRSTPPLYDQLTVKKLEPVSVACDQRSRQVLDQLLQMLPAIQSYLKTLPVAVVNRDLSIQNYRAHESGKVTLLHWQATALDIIPGPVGQKGLKAFEMDQLLASLAEQRDDCDKLTESDLYFVVALYELEQLLTKQMFAAVLEKIPDILKQWERVQTKMIEAHGTE